MLFFGLFCSLNNKIDSCSNLWNIESSNYAGGLIGYTYSSGETVNIENSENRGNIVYNGYSKGYCAGIIGESYVCLNIVNTNNYGTANSGIVDYLSISSRKDDNVLTLINCNNYAEKIEKDSVSEIGGLCGRIYA
mgnify:CR=1 FL=1